MQFECYSVKGEKVSVGMELLFFNFWQRGETDFCNFFFSFRSIENDTLPPPCLFRLRVNPKKKQDLFGKGFMTVLKDLINK